MQISHIILTPYTLPFVRPLKTAQGELRARRGLIVAMADDTGHWGFGDCAPLPGFSRESLADVRQQLDTVATTVHDAPDDTAAILQWPEPTLAPSARSGLEQALLDLHAQRAGVSIARWLVGKRARTTVPVHALVHDATDAQAAVTAGHSTLKIKVGRALADDEARVHAIRDAVGEHITLRLDANGAWPTPDNALHALNAFAAARPHSLEQPLPTSASLDDWRRVVAASPISLAMDESIRTAADLDRVLNAHLPIAAVVLKPMFCGGVLTTLRLAERAHAEGLAVSVTTSLESGVGRHSAIQLSAALPGEPWSCGLDTGRLLANDLVETPVPHGASLPVPTGFDHCDETRAVLCKGRWP